MAGEDAGLRAAEQLVAGEGDEVGAGGDRLARGGLVRQAPGLQPGERARAEVLDEGQAAGVGDGGDLGLRHDLGEALDRVVARVHLHQHRGARADRVLVVAGVGAVGAAHLDELRAGALHDVGHAEGATDLDQLPTRDDDLLALGQRVEQQEDRGGVVIDHGRGLGAGQLGDQRGDEVVAVAASARFEVVFERAGVARGLDHRGDRLLGQRGAAEVGVQHGAGEVEHRTQIRPADGVDASFDRGQQRGELGQRGAVAHGLTGGRELVADGVGDDATPMQGGVRDQRRLGEQAIDCGEGGQVRACHEIVLRRIG